MTRTCAKLLAFLGFLLCPHVASAARSAELLSAASYGYGRVEARMSFAAGDGVVSSFFLWKDGSEQAGTFWNELDFEKLGADCRLQTNPIYGNPSANHVQQHALQLDLCGAFHTYAYEWTPEAIVWLVDGVEIRRETGATPQAFAQNANGGMQVHLNVWPGDASFGGTFNPSILPVHQYVDWVQFSAYQDGAFKLAWREDFAAPTLPAGWATGTWASPKNHSTHAAENVNFIDGYAVLSLTADDAVGPAGATPEATPGTSSAAGSDAGGSQGTSGSAAGGGASSGAGVTTAGTANMASAPTGSAPTSGGCAFHPSRDGSAALGALGFALALLLRGGIGRRRTTVPVCSTDGARCATRRW